MHSEFKVEGRICEMSVKQVLYFRAEAEMGFAQ